MEKLLGSSEGITFDLHRLSRSHKPFSLLSGFGDICYSQFILYAVVSPITQNILISSTKEKCRINSMDSKVTTIHSS